MIRLAYINFWPRDKNDIQDQWFTHFFNKHFDGCTIVPPNESPDILMCSCFGPIVNVIKTNAKCKIYFCGENPDRFPPYNSDKLLYNTFDIILSFKNSIPERNQIRFPLWLIYYNFYDCDNNTNSTANANNLLGYLQESYNKNIKKQKSMLATLVASHDANGIRNIIANNMEKHGKVWYGGRYRNNVGNIGNTVPDKINFISNSVFNICPENSIAEGYCTEKIIHALEAGTIPIYWGAENPEKNIINKNKYCFCNIINQNILNSQIHDVVTNKNKYIEGDLFTKDAHIHLKKIYDDLKTTVEKILSDHQ